jgi:hemolysin activation/secretion protein
MGFKPKVLFVAIFCAFSITTLALAQEVPGSAKSGVVERSLTQPEAIPATTEKRNIFQELDYPKTDLLLDEGKEITVSAFEFTGNTIFKSSVLKKVVAKYVHKPVHFKDLQDALRLINEYYIEKGFFLTRAILPAQDIANGVVNIVVVEGKLGEVVIEGGKFYTANFIKGHFACSANGVVNYHRLFKALILLNEYPDLSVKAVMQKGKEPYTVDVLLKVEDKRPLHFTANYDNYGSRYVSREHFGLGMEYSNLFLGGDKVTLNGVSGISLNALTYGSVGYSTPINAYDTKVGVSYTKSKFDVQREFRRLNARGDSEMISFLVAQPLQRTLTSALDVSLGFDYKTATNYLLGSVSSEDKLRIVKLGLTGNNLDTRFMGRNYFALSASQALSNFMGGSKHDDLGMSRVGVGGNFIKSNLEFARYQKLPLNSMLMLKGSVQAANNSLPVSEQIAIGGADTVRGYAQAEHLGDTGEVFNAELNIPVPFLGDYKVPFVKKEIKDFMRIVGFYDYGKVYLKKPQVGERKHSDIAGAGFGFRFDFGRDLNVKLDFGLPVAGDKSSTGDKVVTYLQVSKKF